VQHVDVDQRWVRRRARFAQVPSHAPDVGFGQKQTCAARKSMSVLCPMADMANTIQQICSGSGPIDYSLVSFIIVVSSPLRSAVNDTLSPGFMALKTSPSWTLK
jgi:hypothetical protein